MNCTHSTATQTPDASGQEHSNTKEATYVTRLEQLFQDLDAPSACQSLRDCGPLLSVNQPQSRSTFTDIVVRAGPSWSQAEIDHSYSKRAWAFLDPENENVVRNGPRRWPRPPRPGREPHTFGRLRPVSGPKQRTYLPHQPESEKVPPGTRQNRGFHAAQQSAGP